MRNFIIVYFYSIKIADNQIRINYFISRSFYSACEYLSHFFYDLVRCFCKIILFISEYHIYLCSYLNIFVKILFSNFRNCICFSRPILRIKKKSGVSNNILSTCLKTVKTCLQAETDNYLIPHIFKYNKLKTVVKNIIIKA